MKGLTVMKDHSEKAEELFLKGYNCSQSVFGAFCEDLGMDIDTGLKISSAFGGGIGRLREVCGAVSGMMMAAGLIYGCSEADQKAKAELYARVQELAGVFKNENGSIICRELLGLSKPEGTNIPAERTAEYYKKRPCQVMVKEAAQILDDYIKTHKPENINLD